MAMSFLHRFFAVHPRPELRELYIFSVLFSFANSLIIIFEPVFFYQQGISLAVISLYFGLHYSLYALVLPLGGKFAARFGLERSLALATPLFVVYFLMLAVLPIWPGLFWVSWIVLTMFKTLYWPAYHAEVSRYGDSSNRGTEISWLFALNRGVGALGPMIGGLVAVHFGFPALFVLAAGFALFASVPLLRTRERFRVQFFAYTGPWKIILSRRFRGARLTMIGWVENYVDLVFWPVFMFIVLGGVDLLGYIATLNILIMTLLGFFIGEVSDRFSRRRVMRFHVSFMVLGYLFRPLALGPWRILLTDSLSKASLIGVRIPQWYHFYSKGKQQGPLKYVVALELTLAIAKAGAAFALAVVFLVMTPFAAFTTAFLMAAVFSLLYLFL